MGVRAARTNLALSALLVLSSLVAGLLLAPGAAAQPGASDVAALQVALRAKGIYGGTVDGLAGPATEQAVRRFQKRKRLLVDGVVGPQTKRALGRFARHDLGKRLLRRGMAGWDVAELQFLLAWHGFPSGTFDGRLGPRVESALLRFQSWAGIGADGRAGPATIAALRGRRPSAPFALAAPVAAPVGDVFGPRGARFHGGVDFPAAGGAPVVAAAGGRVAYAGWLPSGFGYTVSIAHGGGLRTMYAHLSRTFVPVGARVRTGTRIGLVGATGNATGPHLHFEVHLRGALVDPLTALR